MNLIPLLPGLRLTANLEPCSEVGRQEVQILHITRNSSVHPASHQLRAPESPPGPSSAIWFPGDAAPLQFEPFFNISQRKRRRKQKDHLLPLIEKQDRKTDKPREIGTAPWTSTGSREQGNEHSIKDKSILLLLPCDNNTRLLSYILYILGYKNHFIREVSITEMKSHQFTQKELPQHFFPCHSHCAFFSA